MSEEQMIRQLSPVAGDWLLVALHCEDESERWFVERVVLWALMEVEGQIPHVRAITPQGAQRIARVA